MKNIKFFVFIRLWLLCLGLSVIATSSLCLAAENTGFLPKAKIGFLIGPPPKMDGTLNSPAWKHATVITNFVLSKTGKTELAKNQTKVYLLRSNKVIYIGAKCFDSNMKNISSGGWFEIFIADTHLYTYYHFWIHPDGSTGQDGTPGIFLTKAPHWQGKTSIHKYFWAAEMAIPFYNFSSDAKFLDTNTWRFNVCREKFSAPAENSQWSNTGGYFHVPEKFGFLSGMKGVDFTQPAETSLETATSSWHSEPMAGYHFPNYMILNRNYYTREKQASLEIHLSNSTLKKIKGKFNLDIVIKNYQDRVIFKHRKYYQPAKFLFENFKITNMYIGNYNVSASLESNGNRIAYFSESLKKLPFHPGEVKINRFTRMLLVNNKPFIPLICEVEMWGNKFAGSNVPANSIEIAAKKSGFNTFCPWGAYSKSAIDTFNKYGLKVILTPQLSPLWAGQTGQKLTNTMIKNFKEYKDSPNLLAWDTADEGNLGGTTQQFKQRFKILKEIDPYHPIFQNYAGWEVGYGGPGGLNSSDIYCADYGGGGLIDAVNVDAIPRGVPALSLASWISPPEAVCYPTPSETIEWAYNVIIHGAAGGFWWGAHNGRPPIPGLWKAVMQLRKEFDYLAPILDTIPPAIHIECNNSFINFTVRKYKGNYYLITVNTSVKPQKAIFRLDNSKISSNGTSKILFSKKNIIYTKHLLDIPYNGLQRKVLKIAGL
ncbi:MAG: hypothetical protein M1135_02310 [Candidatus Omnitrophica bacterium]|nr:hypothetical protein [Candidatus Omnitrophota bacterium]